MENCSIRKTCAVSSPGCFGVWRRRGALRLRRCSRHLAVHLLLLIRTLSLVPPHVWDVAFVVEVEHLNIVVGGGCLAAAMLVSLLLSSSEIQEDVDENDKHAEVQSLFNHSQ